MRNDVMAGCSPLCVTCYEPPDYGEPPDELACDEDGCGDGMPCVYCRVRVVVPPLPSESIGAPEDDIAW